MKPACPRLFEVEALRDGRLTGPERASFGRHVTICRACGREADALDQLVEQLRARTAIDEPADELRMVRQRTRLLADFDRALLASGRTRPRRWLLGVAAAVTVAGGLLLAPRPRPRPPVAAAPAAIIQPVAGTVWSKHADGEAERIVLDQGTLAIHVDHAASGRRRLIVVLPDGELEDIGTTFTVSAGGGHTRQVVVQEGSVLLRVRGAAPVAVNAGQTWAFEPAPAAGAGAPIRREAPPVPKLASRPVVRTRREPEPAEPEPSGAFRAMVRLLERGDACEAAARSAQFVASYPDDPRLEDAAYLRVVALQRCGSLDDMKHAARDYLRRFPSAFRRAEVERLSR